MPPTPLTEMAAAIRRLERHRLEAPKAHRLSPAVVYADAEAARAEVVRLTLAGRTEEAHAIVRDFEREAGAPIASRLLHSPFDEAA